MNNSDFKSLLLTNDKELVTRLSKGNKHQKKTSAGKERERPEKGKGKGKGKEGKGEKGSGKKGQTPSGGLAAGPTGPQYFDRAKARREEKGEYETIAQEFESHAEVSVDQSKYLGGDLDHTHLVKGLDFALLSKQRATNAKQEKVDHIQEERAKRKAGKQDKREFTTELGKKIWHSVLETLHPHQSGFSKRLQNMGRALSLGQRIRGAPSMFLPGRMFYEFDTGMSASSSDIPRTVFASKEDAPNVDKRRWVAPVMPETVRHVREGLQRALDEKKQRKLARAQGTTTSQAATYAVAQKIVKKPKAMDEDNDIFGGIGAFDPAEAARKAKAAAASSAKRSSSTGAKEDKKASSYFDDAGAQKYQEAPEGQLELDDVDHEELELEQKQDAAAGGSDNVKFEAAERFMGPRAGWVFKTASKGLGYYCEGTAAAAAAKKAAGPVGFTITGPRDARGRAPEKDLNERDRKRKAAAAGVADEEDAYGECFPSAALGNAMVTTGQSLDDQDEEDEPRKKGKLSAATAKKVGGGKKKKGGDADSD